MRDLIGRTLGHYRIVDKIGEGGMGEVYRARDERLDRDVAIKVLPEALAADPDRLRRFEREAKAVAALSHPNILEIHDFDIEGDVTFAVTELLEGETLREHLQTSRGPMPWRRVQEIGASVANGLGAANSKGVIHRDIKPSNIFLCSDGRVKILDFGLAATHEVVDSEAETGSIEAPLTHHGTVMGTVGYMAPEQVRGEPADHRSDIFALGCVLYEMLTGERAFRRNTTAEIMTAILREEPPSLAESGVQLAPDVAKAVQHCLEKKPERRFQSAADLAFALGSESEVIASSVVLSETSQARRWMMPLLAIAGILAVALGMVFGPGILERFGARAEQPPIRSIAILPLENLTGDPEQQYIVDGLHEELIATFAQFSGFEKVIARTSVMGFKDSDTPIREIGQQLDVDAVLEGSVRRSGSTVRATLQLIDADTEDHLWAESFDRDLADILALQSEMARAVAQQVRLALRVTEERRLASARRIDERAVEAYLKARFSTGLAVRERIAFLEQAIEIDPTFASAHSSLAQRLCAAPQNAMQPSEAMPRAHSAALKAVELDNASARAHSVLGQVLFEWFWDWPGAEAEYRMALDLSPNGATVHSEWSWYSVLVGRFDEAVTHSRLALALDPLSNRVHEDLVFTYYVARRYDEAIETARRAIGRFPEKRNGTLHNYLAWCLSMKGHHAEAIDEIDLVIKNVNAELRAYVLGISGWIYARAGRKGKAVERLNELLEMKRHGYVAPTYIAAIYGALGQNDPAFEWLEKALNTRDTELPTLKTDPSWDPLRDDPRFLDILHRMNFPED